MRFVVFYLCIDFSFSDDTLIKLLFMLEFYRNKNTVFNAIWSTAYNSGDKVQYTDYISKIYNKTIKKKKSFIKNLTLIINFKLQFNESIDI